MLLKNSRTCVEQYKALRNKTVRGIKLKINKIALVEVRQDCASEDQK
jgi:hypothetical protein